MMRNYNGSRRLRLTGEIRRAGVLWILILSAAQPAGARDIVVQAGTLLDGTGGAPRSNVSIVIRGERIESIRNGFVSPESAEVVDLRQQTVMPGFIDCHVHMAARLPSRANEIEYAVTHGDIDRAFDGAVHARAMLQQGFTAARDMGGGDDTVALSRAIKAGKAEGPRLWVALEPLSPTAGHGDHRTGLDRDLHNERWTRGIVDSPDEVRKKVRAHKGRGASVIKIMASGGIASRGDDPRAKLMTDEEVATVISTAHELGLKVAAHAYPPNSIQAAVRAGIDSIEHGSFADDATLKLMREKGTVLVPTLTIYDVYYTAASEHPEYLRSPEKELQYDLLPKRNFPRALASGVRIAYGTDLGEGDHSMEFKLLIEGGMSAGAALVAATRTSAELLGTADDIGTIAVGKYADLVATDGSPLSDVDQFSKVMFVMKGGKVHRFNGKPESP